MRVQTTAAVAPRQHLNNIAPELLQQITKDLSPQDTLNLRLSSRSVQQAMLPESQQMALVLTRIAKTRFHRAAEMLGTQRQPSTPSELRAATPHTDHTLLPLPAFSELPWRLQEQVVDAFIARFDQVPHQPYNNAAFLDAFIEMQPPTRDLAMRSLMRHLLKSDIRADTRILLQGLVDRIIIVLPAQERDPQLLRDAVHELARQRCSTSEVLSSFAPLLLEDGRGYRHIRSLPSLPEARIPNEARQLVRETLQRPEPQRTVALQILVHIVANALPLDFRAPQPPGSVGLRTQAFEMALSAIENRPPWVNLDNGSLGSLRQSFQLAVLKLPEADIPALQARVDQLR